MGTESFPGVKCGRGVLLTTHHLPVPRSWNSRAIPLPTLWGTPGLLRDHFSFFFNFTFSCFWMLFGKRIANVRLLLQCMFRVTEQAVVFHLKSDGKHCKVRLVQFLRISLAVGTAYTSQNAGIFSSTAVVAPNLASVSSSFRPE